MLFHFFDFDFVSSALLISLEFLMKMQRSGLKLKRDIFVRVEDEEKILSYVGTGTDVMRKQKNKKNKLQLLIRRRLPSQSGREIEFLKPCSFLFDK